MRAIKFYPCRCLWRGFVQMTRMTPLRLMILQFSQSFFTDARTFILNLFRFDNDPALRQIVRRHFQRYFVAGLKPGRRFSPPLPDTCARTRCPLDNSTRYIVFGRTSTTAPSTLMASSRAMSESPVPIPSPAPYAQNERTVNHLASPLSSRHSILLPPPRPALTIGSMANVIPGRNF